MKYQEPSQEQRANILASSNEQESLCNEKERRRITQVSAPSWWRMIQKNTPLPTKIKLSSNRSAWRKSSILWYIHLLESSEIKSEEITVNKTVTVKSSVRSKRPSTPSL